ncbi:hypothetical protein WG901_10970 [Novosphingobium sp. PS1R-30]|uniref:Uncharacterized protein n=1 Tax=Novosphingobium anseongense TaxID=3133436 RepID=A0ABU8RVN4_9SPHN|nr:MAG: hypothetical protein EOO76_10455 [Novosphingobium sp.]
MSTQFRDLAAQVATDGTIASDEILILRRACWADGKIDADEAEAILAVDGRVSVPNPEWTTFFVEAVHDFLLNGAEPFGEIDEAKADWLLARIDREALPASIAALELLAKLFERLTNVPSRLRSHGIATVERSVLADGIADPEARLLRRLLFAPASDRATGISRAEAELLFRLKQAGTAGGEWQRLFIQGVGNYLAPFTRYDPLSLDRAADLEDFMTRPDDGLGRFFGHLGQRGLLPGFSPAAAAGAVTGELDAFETALIDFLVEERR